MKVEVEIFDCDIVDMIVTAIEGGSNYWYFLPDLSMLKEFVGKDQSEKIGLSALDGAVIPVHDLEDQNEKLGDISKENIERGVKLYLQAGNAFNTETNDAYDADLFLQYVVMGEINFG